MSNIKNFPKKDVPESLIRQALEDSTRTAEYHESMVREMYRSYLSNGWQPIVLRPGTKIPKGDGWQNKTALEEDFTGYHNIGVRLHAENSTGPTDVDLDHPLMIQHADYFLPPTPAKFGRYYGTGEQKLGHRLYRTDMKNPLKISKPGMGTLIEIRCKSGLQTMFPPSFVFDNDIKEMDLVCWEGGSKAKPPSAQDIPFISEHELNQKVKLFAATVTSAQYFTPGTFHNEMLAWMGFLAKSSYSKELIRLSVVWLVEHTGQSNLEDRLASLDDTYHRFENGETLSGITTLKEGGWDEKHIGWLKQLLNPRKSIDSDGRPHIKVVESRETELLDESISAMITTKKFYHQNGQTCIIHRDKARGVLVTPLTDAVAMGSWLTREIMFTKSTMDKASGQYVDQLIKAPPSLAAELANLHTFRGDMPHLSGVSSVPTITAKGRIVEEAWGYDPELEIFFACGYPVRKFHPDEAIKVLCEPFLDFPFVGGVGSKDESSRSGVRLSRYAAAAVSGVLCAVVRPVLDICPLYVVTSSQWQDGKSVLCNTIAAAVGMSEGSANSPLTRGGSDEEQEKQLSSALSRGKRVMIFDNHDGEFRSPALTEVLTSSNPEFRILGKNEVRSIPNKSMCMMNGVNIVLAGDLQTRAVFIRLSRDSVDPHRNFRHDDVVGWAEDNQSSLVSAAISAIEWALQQDDGDWRPTHRFKLWDRLVRRTIMLLCGVDIAPPALYDEDRVLDPIEEAKAVLARFLVTEWENGGLSRISGNVFKASGVHISGELEAAVEVLTYGSRASDSVKVGKCLTKMVGAPLVVGGMPGVYKLRSKPRDGTSVYWVERVE